MKDEGFYHLCLGHVEVSLLFLQSGGVTPKWGGLYKPTRRMGSRD